MSLQHNILRNIFADLFSSNPSANRSEKAQKVLRAKTPAAKKKAGYTRQGSSPTKTIVKHPRLGDVTISHTRQFRRISVTVRADGRIRLNIPAECSIKSGMEFLTAKEEWIAHTLEKNNLSHPKVVTAPYATAWHNLEFHPSGEIGKISSLITEDTIKVTFPDSLSPDSETVQSATRDAILKTLRSEAKAYLPTRVAELAAQHGMKYGAVTIRATHTRWGSCSSRNDISLSLFLMRLPRNLIDYIIIHELCHTIHKDHSTRFHTLTNSLLNGKEAQFRAELRQYRPDIL